MADKDGQLLAEYKKGIHSNAKDISSMLVIDNNKIVIADKATNIIQLFMLENYEFTNAIPLKNVGWWGITDMALVDSETFAVLVPGFWTKSDIRIFKLDKDNRINQVETLKISRRSFGLCYQKDHFFVTNSPSTLFRKAEYGCVKMISKRGIKQQEFTIDNESNVIFGNPLSKIYVDKNFRMFVSDEERRELVILKIDSINREVTILARHNYLVLDIATKLDGTSFLATGHRDGVVLLHDNGGWVFNNFLTCKKLDGKPLAVAFNEKDQQLLVITRKHHWYSPWSWLVLLVYDVKYTHSTDVHVTIEN